MCVRKKIELIQQEIKAESKSFNISVGITMYSWLISQILHEMMQNTSLISSIIAVFIIFLSHTVFICKRIECKLPHWIAP